MSSHQLFMVLACWILRENNLDRVFYWKKNCGQKQGWQTVNALGVIHSQHGCHHMITSLHLLYHFILIFSYFTFLLFIFCLTFYYLLDFPFILVKHIELTLCTVWNALYNISLRKINFIHVNMALFTLALLHCSTVVPHVVCHLHLSLSVLGIHLPLTGPHFWFSALFVQKKLSDC